MSEQGKDRSDFWVVRRSAMVELDIHAHSPASFDYGGLEGKANEQLKPSFKEWIKAYIDAGVDGIVVTDHNSHTGVDPAREALAQLREEDHDLPPFVIFPGLELTASGGYHVLGIFAPEADAEIVNKVLNLCAYSGTRGDSDETANKTVLDAAKAIVAEGGICVPAHADQSCGVFSMDLRELHALGSVDSVIASKSLTTRTSARRISGAGFRYSDPTRTT